MTTFSLLRDSLTHGAQMANRHWKALVVASIVYALTVWLPDLLGYVMDSSSPAFYLIGIVVAFLNVSFGIGMARMARLLEDGKPAHWSLLFSYTAYVLPLLGITVAFLGCLLALAFVGRYALPASNGGSGLWSTENLPVALGLLGGAYIYFRATFFAYALAAEPGISTWESIRKSFRATRGWFWFSVLLGIAELLAYAIGILALGFGLLWTIPLTLFATNYAFERIRGPRDLTSAGA